MAAYVTRQVDVKIVLVKEFDFQLYEAADISNEL